MTSGPYAVIRHPLYLDEIAAMGGVMLQYLSAWSLSLLGLVCAFRFQRIRLAKYEEQVFRQTFPEYPDYMTRTAGLVPHYTNSCAPMIGCVNSCRAAAKTTMASHYASTPAQA